MRLPRFIMIGVCLTALVACGGGDRGVQQFRDASNGPDEFTSLPVATLETPPSLTELPTPTPGGANLTDPQPRADAIAALGGNPAALGATAVPASDGALVNHVSRFGVSGDIRATLAEEDARLRTNRARFGGGGLFSRVNPYFRVYARQALDAYAELARFRAAGVKTPSAPPAE